MTIKSAEGVESSHKEIGFSSKHKAFVEHLYNVGTTYSTLVQHCTNVIHMFYTNVLRLLGCARRIYIFSNFEAFS